MGSPTVLSTRKLLRFVLTHSSPLTQCTYSSRCRIKILTLCLSMISKNARVLDTWVYLQIIRCSHHLIGDHTHHKNVLLSNPHPRCTNKFRHLDNQIQVDASWLHTLNSRGTTKIPFGCPVEPEVYKINKGSLHP